MAEDWLTGHKINGIGRANVGWNLIGEAEVYRFDDFGWLA